MQPARRRNDDETRRRVRDLVSVSEGDPLAPFALRRDKQYVFSPDGEAAIGYRVRLGVAVASGDPVGAPESWDAAIGEFVVMASRRKLRIAAIGAGERMHASWSGHGLGSVPIGRDVVLHRDTFTLSGRQYRNVRQAIQRTRNSGITVEFQREGELPTAVEQELRAVMARTRGLNERGFSMILGNLFNGFEPDAVIAIARDADGRFVAAHRYLWAGKQDLSLDFPIRVEHAPNGVDERIAAEVVQWGAEHGVERVSLAFAPFPDLFENRASLGLVGTLLYGITHLLDPLIRVERLYRYLRKFHAFDQQRYVMLRWRQVVVVAIALLLLEFGH
jgi:lysylphosphatidylglycerol synthetase-like protein (DUF2156 family)